MAHQVDALLDHLAMLPGKAGGGDEGSMDYAGGRGKTPSVVGELLGEGRRLAERLGGSPGPCWQVSWFLGRGAGLVADRVYVVQDLALHR